MACGFVVQAVRLPFAPHASGRDHTHAGKDQEWHDASAEEKSRGRESSEPEKCASCGEKDARFPSNMCISLTRHLAFARSIRSMLTPITNMIMDLA